jgi:asparagine synthase (glutamine-hydrolysing)
MCGIAGAVWFRPEKRLDPSRLRQMTDALVHRGPDDQGVYFQELQRRSDSAPASQAPAGVALGFRRLAIIDLVSGNQPLSNEDGSIRLIFNGEIYNYRDLRKRLEGAGHQFATDSDSETIVHLYEDLGLGCFEHLNGMFAIAIWDSRNNRLVLARDRLGKKPLYYHCHDGRLLFASELKSLATVPDLARTINPEAIDLYFTYQYIPHPSTIYQNVFKLEPGTLGVYENDQWRTEGYWKIDWKQERSVSPEQAKAQLQELLTDSVRLRLRSDVPLGAFLSGGIDSSLLVAIAQRELNQPIQTYAIGFGESDFDETQFAQQVADHVGTNHRRFEVQPQAAEILDRLAYAYDEPFSDSSALPTWYLCQQTKQQVTVAISGDGGDELFAGYDRYRALQWSQPLSGLKLDRISRLMEKLPGLAATSNRRSLFRRLQRFTEALGQPPARRYLQWLQIFNEASRWEMYRDDFIEQLPPRDPFAFLQKAWETSGPRDLISKASLADIQTYLPCDLMTKVDIASMAHSLEVRQPFLDYRLVEFAASLPSSLKYRFGKGKQLLRETFGSWLPDAIWKRKKMGFGIPVAAWFRGPLREQSKEMLLGSDARCHRFLKPDILEQLYTRHVRQTSNEGYRLWSLLMFEAWLRRWEN